MINQNNEEPRIEILLAEYQACHLNRNHYDSIRWIIGSIFLVAILSLFGLSFHKEIDPNGIKYIAIFSSLLYTIWLAYHWRVHPFIKISMERMCEIEKKLTKELKKSNETKVDYEMLHTRINKKTTEGVGILILIILSMIVFLGWIFRILLFN